MSESRRGADEVVPVPEAPPSQRGAQVPTGQPSGAAVGVEWLIFAGVVMIIEGSFEILAGLSALINSDLFGDSVDTIFEQNAESWGWWHLAIGGVIVLAGLGVFTGNIAARIVGVIAAAISAIAAFAWLPIYPIWGVVVIAVDIAVIWALTVHGRAIQKAERMGEF
jgi:hypothetical protein